MDAIVKDLDKLESKSCGSSTAASSIQASIASLERWRDALMAGDDGEAGAAGLEDGHNTVLGPDYVYADALAESAIHQLTSSAPKITESHKEWSSALTKYGKSVDKVCSSIQREARPAHAGRHPEIQYRPVAVAAGRNVGFCRR